MKNKLIIKEIKDLKFHFKKDKWDLCYTSYVDFLRRAGCPEFDVAKIIVEAGFRIVYSKKFEGLVIRK